MIICSDKSDETCSCVNSVQPYRPIPASMQDLIPTLAALYAAISNITYVSSIYIHSQNILLAGIGLYGYTELTQLLVSSPFIITIPISFLNFQLF